MVAAEPRVRRRGMFVHVETPELDHVEVESAEGVSIRLRVARPRAERHDVSIVANLRMDGRAIPTARASSSVTDERYRLRDPIEEIDIVVRTNGDWP